MKRYFLSLLFITLAVACGFPPDAQQANAVVGLGNPDPMSRECIAGYTRTEANTCTRTGGVVTIGPAVNGACNSVDWFTLSGIPLSAKSIILKERGIIRSNAAIALREMDVSYYADAACVTNIQNSFIGVREFAAVAANTALLLHNQEIVNPFIDGLARTYLRASVIGTGAHILALDIVGYTD